MADEKKDSYLESLYLTLEMCNLTIQYADRFDPGVVEKAFSVKKKTLELIRLRELISIDDRI